MSEDLPFGTHGGLAVRHTFPLDGEYTFKLRLQRNTIGDTIRGIDDEHEIEVRIDHALVKRFRSAVRYKGSDPGFVDSRIPEDDVEGKRLHTYRLNADKDLEFSCRSRPAPGSRVGGVHRYAPAVSEVVPLAPSSLKRSSFTDDAGEPGIEYVSSLGTSGSDVGAGHAEPAANLRLPADRPRGTKTPARGRSRARWRAGPIAGR